MNDEQAKYEAEMQAAAYAEAEAQAQADEQAAMQNEQSDGKYLGDGLYAFFDGYHVILKTQRLNGEHWVALEPQVLISFLKYAAKFYPTLGDVLRELEGGR